MYKLISISFQLIILMALAKGRSVVRSGPITLHTRTAIHVAELMTKVCAIHTIQSEGLRNYCHSIILIITGQVYHRESRGQR